MKVRIREDGFNRFCEKVDENALGEKSAALMQGAMDLLLFVAWSPHETVGELDMAKYKPEHFNLALEQVIEYVSDEGSEDEGCNLDNLLTEIDRIAYFKQITDGLKPHTSKRKFI